MRVSLISIALLALPACHQRDEQSGGQGSSAGSIAATQSRGVHRQFRGKSAPQAAFVDANGKSAKVADFSGRPVLVNLWASWCAPCVKELPTLDKLARTGRIRVIAVSQDSGPQASVVAFLKAHGISTLQSYQDPHMGLSGALGPDTVLPTSILFDAKGREVWRFIGDQDWTSSEASKLLSERGSRG